jgi:Fur family peroxide stress response transcriptional regulator
VQLNENIDLDEFRRICRIHSLKLTPQRIALFEVLQGEKEHPSAQTIYKKIRKRYNTISFDTVHRTLNTFVEIGLLEVVEGLGEPRRFDADRSPHHHMQCVRCGAIIDFTNPRYDSLDIPESVANNYRVLGKRVVIHIVCPGCDAAGKK